MNNRILLDSLKKILDNAKRLRVEELPKMLWAYRTTPRTTVGESPFTLTYGIEALALVEVGLPSLVKGDQ